MSQGASEIAVIIGVMIASVVVHALLQSRIKSDVLRRHNDVAGYLFSAVGVIYAVVLGFVVVVVWEKYDATVANVDAEIAAVSDLYRSVGGMPGTGPVVRRELTEYADAMIRVEWPQMSREASIGPDLAVLEDIAHRIRTYEPSNRGDANVQQIAMEDSRRLFDARRLRVIQSAPSVPLVLWSALFAGAIAMLLFAYLFGVENRPAQLVMTAILAGIITIMFVVIYEFDSPFSGSVSISPQGWITVRQHLPQIP